MTDHLSLTRSTMRSSHYQEQQHHADGVGVATQRCQKKKTANDETHHIMKNNHRLHLHHPTVHSSPLRPSRLFSTSKKGSSNNHLSTNASDASSSSLIQQLPRQLTKKEETDLRKRIMFQLNISRSSRRQIENEEDAENLVNYALELITGGELVGTVVEELKFVEMSVCGNAEADNIGIALTEFFTGMSDVATRNNRRYSYVAAPTTTEEACDDDDDGIAAVKKKLAAKKKAATKLSPTKKVAREIDEMPPPPSPPSPPPPDTISPPLIQKKHAQPLFSSPKMSIDIMTKSHGSPRDVIQAASKEFGFIKDGSADGIFRLHTQWDDMKKTVEMTNNPKPPVDDVDHDDVSFMDNHDTIMDWNEGGEESEFIGDVVEEPYPPRFVFVYGSSSVVEGDNRSVVATSSSNVTPLRSEQSTKEDAVQTSQRCSSTSLQVITPVEDLEVSKLLVQKRKKNIKKILEKSRSGFYGGQCQTLATHTSAGRNFSLVGSETADTALGVVSNLHKHNVEGADVVSNSLKKIENRNDAQLDITEGRQESSPTVHNNNEVKSKQPTISDDDDNGPLQQTREHQQARVMKIKTMSEYVAKIDSMRDELLREIEWQHQKQAQMTKIKKMEECVEKIDSMKGDLLQEIKCMKAELQTNSIDDSNDEKKKRDEAKLVVYQLSCRKCKRNHTSYIGTSSLDIKTTLDRHFERVVVAVQNKGKCLIASDSNDNRVEQWSNDFAMHFARHCQPRFGSKKLMSKTDVFNFCIANVKVEVLGSNDMIYGCTVDGKVAASAATRRV